MAYDQDLVQRIRAYFCGRTDVQEKSLFGGLAFMLAGHMCVGANGHRLMARIGPARYKKVMDSMYVTIMDITGKPLTGFVYVEPEGLSSDQHLHQWIEQCEHFVHTLPPK